MSSQSYRRDQVVSIIDAVIHKVRQPDGFPRDMICNELQGLKAIMEDLRQQLGASDVHSHHIPSATDELDAVAGATEEATVAIMGACENILQVLKDAPQEYAQPTAAEVTRIYEACTFQDITGQRIAKVIRTLKTIDARVASLLDAAGLEDEGGAAPREEAGLLNGPALHGALSQDDIDRMLEGF